MPYLLLISLVLLYTLFLRCIAVAWVRHEERLLFQKFPEVVFMDFTANTTKEKRPLYHMCFKTNTGLTTPPKTIHKIKCNTVDKRQKSNKLNNLQKRNDNTNDIRHYTIDKRNHTIPKYKKKDERQTQDNKDYKKQKTCDKEDKTPSRTRNTLDKRQHTRPKTKDMRIQDKILKTKDKRQRHPLLLIKVRVPSPCGLTSLTSKAGFVLFCTKCVKFVYAFDIIIVCGV